MAWHLIQFNSVLQFAGCALIFAPLSPNEVPFLESTITHLKIHMLLDFLLERRVTIFSARKHSHFVRVFIFWPNFKNGKLASMPYKYHLFLTMCNRLDLKYAQCNHEHINVEHRTDCTSAPFAISTVASTCCHMHYWLKIAAINKQVRSISSQFGDASMETF